MAKLRITNNEVSLPLSCFHVIAPTIKATSIVYGYLTPSLKKERHNSRARPFICLVYDLASSFPPVHPFELDVPGQSRFGLSSSF